MKFLVTIFLLLCGSASCWAQNAPGAVVSAPQPLVRLTLEPTSGIVVGQTVRLTVAVLVPNYFMGSPDFPEFEIENCIVMLSQEPAHNISEQVNGVSYSGIVQQYLIYPEQSGTFRLPRAEIGVRFADVPPHAVNAKVPFPAAGFRAEIPEAAQGLDYFLPTTQLELKQKWESPIKNLKIGQTIERSVTVTTEKLQGMLIPPIELRAPDGVRVYEDQPSVLDQKSDRGEFLGGRRTESAKYLIQKPGDYTLPPINVTWWDLKASRVRTATLPAAHFTAVADPAFSAEIPPPAEAIPVSKPPEMSVRVKLKSFAQRFGIWLAAFLVLAFLAWRLVPVAARGYKRWRQEYSDSESAHFRRLLRSCRSNDAAECYRNLLRWLAHSRPGLTVTKFLAQANDPALSAAVESLGTQLYSDAKVSSCSGDQLAARLKQNRRSVIETATSRKALPDLNPPMHARRS
jgi:BatD DUF11 like domain